MGKVSVLILLRRLFLLLARHSLQAASALASCVGSVFRFPFSVGLAPAVVSRGVVGKVFHFSFFAPFFDGIEWQSGFQPLMTFSGSAVQRTA